MALYLGNSFIQNIAVGSGNNGVDTTDATATASDMLKGATAYVNDQKITGTIETVQVATPEITFDENGVITSTVNQSGGYTPGGSKSATRPLPAENGKTIIPNKSEQVAISQGKFAKGDIKVAQIPDEYQDVSGVTATATDVLEGKVIVGADGNPITGTIPSVDGATITPGTSNKTAVAAGKYTTGAITVQGDSNLKAANIKSGTSIFGVVGSMKPALKVVTGTVTVTDSNSFSIPLTYTKLYTAFIACQSLIYPTENIYVSGYYDALDTLGNTQIGMYSCAHSDSGYSNYVSRGIVIRVPTGQSYAVNVTFEGDSNYQLKGTYYYFIMGEIS